MKKLILLISLLYATTSMAVTTYNFTFNNYSNDDIEQFMLAWVGGPISDLLDCTPDHGYIDRIYSAQSVTFFCTLKDPKRTGGGPLRAYFALVHSEQLSQGCYVNVPRGEPDSTNNYTWNIYPWKNGYVHCCNANNVCDR